MVYNCAQTQMQFEWNSEKAKLNACKHGVLFADTVSVFDDDRALTASESSVEDEERFVTLGADLFGRILVVVYTWRGDRTRIISARKATRNERKQYAEVR